MNNWKRLKLEIRRYFAAIFLGWFIKTIPPEDYAKVMLHVGRLCDVMADSE